MEIIPSTWVSLRRIPPLHQHESPLTTILHSHWHESSCQLICQGSTHGRNIQIRGKRFRNTWSFFLFFFKKMCFRKYWKKYYNNCLHNSKLMMSLTRFLPVPKHNTIHSPKKRKKTLIQNRRESVDSKVLTIQKLWQFFFFFQEGKKGFWHVCWFMIAWMQKPKRPIFFTLGFDKEPRSSLCVCVFLVGIQLEKSTSSSYLLQENFVIHNMYVCGWVSEANDYLHFIVTDLHLWTQGSFGYLYYHSPKRLYTLLRWWNCQRHCHLCWAYTPPTDSDDRMR